MTRREVEIIISALEDYPDFHKGLWLLAAELSGAMMFYEDNPDEEFRLVNDAWFSNRCLKAAKHEAKGDAK